MAIGHIYIYGEVGNQVTFDNVLKGIGKFDSYAIHIHSPGGDVFEGFAIYNALKNTKKPITAYIEGLCASIATLIAGAADKIIMNEKSQFMIHNPLVTNTGGDSQDLRNVADQLDKIKTQLIDVYQKRTGLPTETLWDMYDNETWLLPEQAKEMGFVDEVAESLKAVATAKHQTSKQMKWNERLNNLLIDFKNALAIEGEPAPNAEPKAQVQETLEDGTVIVVLSEDGDFTGKQVVYEDGSPLPAGDYTLQSGKVLVVADGGVITEIQDASMTDESQALKDQIEALTKENAELKSAMEANTKAVTSAEAKVNKFQNLLTQATAELEKIKNTSVGGDTAPDRGIKKNPIKQSESTQMGPMDDLMVKAFKQQHAEQFEDDED